MYVPSHFAPDDEAIADLLSRGRAADLVTVTPQGLVASFLPLLYDPVAGVLQGHLARNNEHWRLAESTDVESLVIVRGPDAYVSPTWYASKAENGRVVPTWNYVTAHVYGRLVAHDDPAWVGAFVRRLTDVHEAGRAAPWSVDDAPAAYIDGQLRAIVGVEVVISRIEGKFKLSQNKPEADARGVVAGLEAEGESEIAELMRKVYP